MKKRRLGLMAIAVLAVAGAVLAGCVSTGSGAAGVGGAAVSFNGFWEMPSGDLMYFKENAFVAFRQNGRYISDGLFVNTNNQIVLHLEEDSVDHITYTIVSGNIRVTSRNNQWMNGLWRKRDDVSITADDPLTGYWEHKTENQMRILHIWNGLMGSLFVCDMEYNISSKSDIEYNSSAPSELKATITGEGFSIGIPYRFFFDGGDLVIGLGDMESTYNRYVKK